MSKSCVSSLASLLLLCALAAEEFDPTKPLGSIKGVVTWQGDIPTPIQFSTSGTPIKVNRSFTIRSEDFVINADRKVANVVVYVSKGLENLSFQKMTLPPTVLRDGNLCLKPHVTCMMV